MHNLSLFIIATCICLASPICKAAEHGPAHTIFAEASARKDKKKEKTVVEEKNTIEQLKRLPGEWIILSAMDKPVDMRTNLPFIYFNAPDGRIYGNLGCNIVNGCYEATADGKLTFSDVLSTMQYCDYIRDESNILEGLNTAASFNIYTKDNLHYIDIFDTQGNVLIQGKRHNANFLSGTWKVVKIEENDIAGSDIELVFDIPELKLHGKAGCNIINGAIGIDRKKDWFIQFQSIISTRMLCDEQTMAIERDLLIALEEVETISREDRDNATLLDKNGNAVLVLQRIDPKEN